MSIHIQATYKDGVIHPDQPLALPNNVKVEVTVTPVESNAVSDTTTFAAGRISPGSSVEEFREFIKRHAVHAASLPVDFSRADIYSDHD